MKQPRLRPRNRANIGAALDLMEQAGYTVQDGVMADADGEEFTFEILLKSGSSENQSMIDMFTESLSRLGITPYVIPIYQWNISRIAHDKNLHYPDTMPIFGDWPGWQPDVWWYEEG